MAGAWKGEASNKAAVTIMAAKQRESKELRRMDCSGNCIEHECRQVLRVQV